MEPESTTDTEPIVFTTVLGDGTTLTIIDDVVQPVEAKKDSSD